MKTLLLFLSLSLCVSVAYPQTDGFFNVYKDMEKSFCASSVIETDDGCLIVAVYDYDAGAGELKKMSSTGEMLARMPISDENVFSGIEGLYHDPDNPELFYAIGHVIHWDEQITRPYVLHFDGDLNILDRKEVNLPRDYRRFVMSRAIMTQEGDFIYATSLDAQDDYHRLYMRIASDGTLLKFHEETEDCGNAILINAIFEFPEGNRFGDYRSSYLVEGYLTQVTRLFGFDDGFVFDTLQEYENITETEGVYIHSISKISIANSTVISLNDSVLLFSEEVHESWSLPSGSTPKTDRSTLLSSTDLDGNIKNYLVIGSDNDTVDYPVAFNAIGIAKNDSDEVQVFHGCFGNTGILPCSKPYNIVITKTDANLNVIWQKSYTHPSLFLQATYLYATNDGGCIVVGGAYDHNSNHYDLFALKIDGNGTLGTDEIIVEDFVTIYPNPANTTVTIKGKDLKQIELLNMQGQHLVTHYVESPEITIDISDMPAGIFFLGITDESGKYCVRKLVKK
ncbi:MAG: T9SS type A sorting domain-containing protein [Bacteroidales bacterium]|nr:T9SS type A sorting domain-containing protein [Bacteroidales bacterium]